MKLTKVNDPAALREIERLKREVAKQSATTEYVAMMADIDIWADEEDEDAID